MGIDISGIIFVSPLYNALAVFLIIAKIKIIEFICDIQCEDILCRKEQC